MSSASRPLVGRSLILGVLLGALTWAAWLGWDRTSSYDVITHGYQHPYVTLQVLGCALTVGAVTALLAVRAHPVAGPGGVAIGFWVCWTVDAGSQDETGMFAVGAVLLAFGLALGVGLTAAIAGGVHASIADRRRRRDERG